MRAPALVAAAALVVLLSAACGSSNKSSSSTTTAASGASSCTPDQLTLVKKGQLTVATDNPAFPPWFGGGTPKGSTWKFNDPTTGKGYESAVAYAVAKKLGFQRSAVKWVVVPFEQLFKPGKAAYDFDINQVSVTPQRKQSVTFSDSYYNTNQALVAIKGTPITKAKTLADLKKYKLGAQLGTTSLTTINDTIQPDQEPSVFSTNNDALSGLKAKQVDGVVVDFPTALYMAAVQLKGGKVVGRFAADGKEYFGLVLQKDSPLTSCVNEALARVKDAGTLDTLQQKWLGGSAPVFK